jgi:hypothetical protein
MRSEESQKINQSSLIINHLYSLPHEIAKRYLFGGVYTDQGRSQQYNNVDIVSPKAPGFIPGVHNSIPYRKPRNCRGLSFYLAPSPVLGGLFLNSAF